MHSFNEGYFVPSTTKTEKSIRLKNHLMKHFLLFATFVAVFQSTAQKNYTVYNRLTLEKIETVSVTSNTPEATFKVTEGEITTKGLKTGSQITISSAGFTEQTLTLSDLNKATEKIYLTPNDSLFNEYKKNYPFYNALSDTSGVIQKPDQMAQFPGGVSAMKRFLEENIIYPEESLEKVLAGKVYLQFLVEIDGTISDVSVVRGLTLEMDSEAVRVVSIMPKWEPAIHAGAPVRCIFNLPIVFNLQ